MKNRIRHLLQFGSVLALAVCAIPVVHAQDEPTTARAKFSDPGKPGTFKCNVPWAEIRVTGTDESEVVVISSINQKGKSETDREGFRRLDDELTFELVERDNVVSLQIAGDNPWAAHGTEFEVRVPRNTNLSLRTEAGGDIQVVDVAGDIEVKSTNGQVDLKNVTNASVETMNGEITASFANVPAKPVSLTTMNGQIDLRLPADTKANLRMRTHNGSIRTNFPESMLQSRTETSVRTPGVTGGHGVRGIDAEAIRRETREAVQLARELAAADERRARETGKATGGIGAAPSAPATPGTPVAPVAPRAPRFPHFGGKTVAGELNGGGVDITLTSMNGTITLRQLK